MDFLETRKPDFQLGREGNWLIMQCWQ